jgi:hypothetical protein
LGVQGLCIEARDAAAIVEAGRDTAAGDVSVRGHRIEIVCESILFSGVWHGDEIVGHWGGVTDARTSAGEFYLVRKESVPNPKADILRAKAAQSTTPQAAIRVFVITLLAALDGFARGRWGVCTWAFCLAASSLPLWLGTRSLCADEAALGCAR